MISTLFERPSHKKKKNDQAEKLWIEVKAQLHKILDKEGIRILDQVTPLHFENHALWLACPDSFTCAWVSKKYARLIEALLEIKDQKIELNICVKNRDS